MIIGSMVFVLVAAGLFVVGVVRADTAFYYVSIVASAIAALALLAGVRQRPGRPGADDFTVRPISAQRPEPATGQAGVPRRAVAATSPALAVGGARPGQAPASGVLPDPPDEPAAQAISAQEASRVVRLTADVAVIDGRPRYHTAVCVHLLGRDPERLAVKEAVALGFTPCGACRPVTVLLGEEQP